MQTVQTVQIPKELFIQLCKYTANSKLFDELMMCAFTEQEEQPETSKTIEELWYPDDSGEWVEVPSNVRSYDDLGICANIEVDVLLKSERDSKSHLGCIDTVCRWGWNKQGDDRIVAYKIVG